MQRQTWDHLRSDEAKSRECSDEAPANAAGSDSTDAKSVNFKSMDAPSGMHEFWFEHGSLLEEDETREQAS